MPIEQYQNLAWSTLLDPIQSAYDTLEVAEPGNFPSEGTFKLNIDNELINVNSVIDGVFHVTRGIEGTTATNHMRAAVVTHVLTVASLRALPAGRYVETFTNDDLENGILDVAHERGSENVLAVIYDNENKQIIPSEITLIDSDSLQVDLSSFGTITGEWRIIVI